MSRYLRGAALAALTVAAACAVSSAASAQTYNRLVVFGDSLSDNGNLFAASFGTQPPITKSQRHVTKVCTLFGKPFIRNGNIKPSVN